MAGKNQHYIPQFLQRGFSCQAAQGFAPKSKKDNNNAQIWLFKRESEKIAHIRKEGAEKYFYGPENSHVDKTITYAESSYGKLVNILRAYTKDHYVQEDHIPELLAHMFIRSRNIRQTLVTLGDSMLDLLNRSLPDAEYATEWFVSYLQKNLDKAGNHLPDEQRHLFREIIQNNPESIRNLMKERKIMEELIPQFRDAISPSEMDINEMVKTAHIDALSESIEPQARVELYRGLHWFLSVKKPGSYILGDALVLCQKPNGDYSAILSADEDFQSVFLPISSQHLLVGTKEVANLDVDVECINYASACMSSDFFIASQNTKRESVYQKDLGKGHSAFLDEKNVEMETIANQYWIS
jgi:Protein of unknown function (DUF4238)